MNKFMKLCAAAALACSMAACGNAADTGTDDAVDASLSGTYSIHVTGDDWGCGVDKVIITLDKEIEGVETDTFTVSEHKQDTDWTAEDFPVVLVDRERTITGAYLSDANGEKVDGPSKYVTLELYISPSDGSPFLYSMATSFNTWSDPYELTIALAEGKTLSADGVEISEFSFSGAPASKTTDADVFTPGTFESSDGYTMNYSVYTPEEASTTLFVWLHGMGEGGSAQVDGTDWMVPVLANEVTAYASETFQEILGGANVLVPQAPTYWMDTTGDASDSENRLAAADGTSAYTVSLHELIDQIKEETGSENIIIAGCSNGGYMTVVMAMNYGDEYTAYVPICEAVPDEAITDEQIAALAELPMYFIWAENDPTVDPATHEIPTIERLNAAGASQIVTATTPDVHDTTGRFTDENGDPHQYSGHWSWITFDNNEAVTSDGVGAWEWMAQQINK